jgi:hypothetical protein
MIKLALGMGSVVMMLLTMVVAYIAMSVWISAARYFLLK